MIYVAQVYLPDDETMHGRGETIMVPQLHINTNPYPC